MAKKQFDTKGQFISKCPFGVIVWTKIPTNCFENFCPRTEKWSNHKMKVLNNVFDTLNNPFDSK